MMLERKILGRVLCWRSAFLFLPASSVVRINMLYDGNILMLAVAGRHRMVPVFTAAGFKMQYVDTLFCWHWVPLGLLCQHSSKFRFSAVLFHSSVSGSCCLHL